MQYNTGVVGCGPSTRSAMWLLSSLRDSMYIHTRSAADAAHPTESRRRSNAMAREACAAPTCNRRHRRPPTQPLPPSAHAKAGADPNPLPLILDSPQQTKPRLPQPNPTALAPASYPARPPSLLPPSLSRRRNPSTALRHSHHLPTLASQQLSAFHINGLLFIRQPYSALPVQARSQKCCGMRCTLYTLCISFLYMGHARRRQD
jgi:hypothetical protein